MGGLSQQPLPDPLLAGDDRPFWPPSPGACRTWHQELAPSPGMSTCPAEASSRGLKIVGENAGVIGLSAALWYTSSLLCAWDFLESGLLKDLRGWRCPRDAPAAASILAPWCPGLVLAAWGRPPGFTGSLPQMHVSHTLWWVHFSCFLKVTKFPTGQTCPRCSRETDTES